VTDEALPPGWSVELDPGARRIDGGTVLVGGTPLRVLRFSPAGARWLDAVAGGGAVPPFTGSRRLARRLVDAGIARPVPPSGAGPAATAAAVVVPVRDDAAGLARTLGAVTSMGVADVVVVDDASADEAAVATAAAGTGARVVRSERRLGAAGARERGWRACEAPIVVFLDAQVRPTGEGGREGDGGAWLAALLAHFDDPAVGAVAPRVTSATGSAPPWLAAYEAVRSPLDMGGRAAAVRPGGAVGYVPTAALVVRRAALDAVGGFDPDLRVGEDVDLVWRLVAAGWRVHYEASVTASHPARPGLGAWARQRFAYGTSAAPLAARHGEAVTPLRLSGWSAMAWSAVLGGRPGLGAAIGVGTTTAMAPKLRRLRHPGREAARIAGLGNLRAGEAVADALWRPWWPLAVALALFVRRSRVPLLLAALVPPVLEWRRRRLALGVATFVALRRADDMAYGSGVWAGCLRARPVSLRALLPSFTGPMTPPEPVGPTGPAGTTGPAEGSGAVGRADAASN
jgi:mycofactocin system glycosyltransferase